MNFGISAFWSRACHPFLTLVGFEPYRIALGAPRKNRGPSQCLGVEPDGAVVLALPNIGGRHMYLEGNPASVMGLLSNLRYILVYRFVRYILDSCNVDT